MKLHQQWKKELVRAPLNKYRHHDHHRALLLIATEFIAA